MLCVSEPLKTSSPLSIRNPLPSLFQTLQHAQSRGEELYGLCEYTTPPKLYIDEGRARSERASRLAGFDDGGSCADACSFEAHKRLRLINGATVERD